MSDNRKINLILIGFSLLFSFFFSLDSFSQITGADPIIINNQCFEKLTITVNMKVDPLKNCYEWIKTVQIKPHTSFTFNVPNDQCDYQISGSGICTGLRSGSKYDLTAEGKGFLKSCTCAHQK